MIPVLGIPILNGQDRLKDMLDSIDVPVGEIIIVDNGDVVTESEHTVIKPKCNLGVGASWNLVIKSRPKAEWWAMSNHDLVYSPGDLQRLIDSMGEVVMLGAGFSIFGISRNAVKQLGYFDENFHPAYFEDNDYDYRCRLSGVEIKSIPSGSKHAVSSTLVDDPQYRRQNLPTFMSNRDYYHKKWGGRPYAETFKTPFDLGGDPNEWTVDIDRLSQQGWVRASDR